jgi:FkbM family methyltransferase
VGINTIIAFEPIPSLVQMLKEQFKNNPKVKIHAKALGSRNSKEKFNVLTYECSSSLLSPTKAAEHYHGEGMRKKMEIDVEVVRLDEIYQERQSPDIIKLDLQGYELEALKGSIGVLEKARVIATEIEFLPLYNGQALFSDIDLFLRSQGFFLYNFYELWTKTDGQLESGDALFLNSRFFSCPPKI